MSGFYSDSIFWVEVEKIQPNPYQPRKEFDEARLSDLASSIRQYGILQPLVVTRREFTKEDGGIGVAYELIAGERRLRASKIAGLSQVPVLIKDEEQNDMLKLELAIIENLQREDLNAIDRARAFERLANEFHFKHQEIAKKVGKSREYVSNTIRLLMLPADMQTALSEGRISEGHTRPLLMLIERKEEQEVLFREIMLKKLTVREAEGIARRIAFERARKHERTYDPDIMEMEQRLTEALGTRVAIENTQAGGKLVINFFSDEDLRHLLSIFNDKARGAQTLPVAPAGAVHVENTGEIVPPSDQIDEGGVEMAPAEPEAPIDDRSKEEIRQVNEDEFDPNSFSI